MSSTFQITCIAEGAQHIFGACILSNQGQPWAYPVFYNLHAEHYKSQLLMLRPMADLITRTRCPGSRTPRWKTPLEESKPWCYVLQSITLQKQSSSYHQQNPNNIKSGVLGILSCALSSQFDLASCLNCTSLCLLTIGRWQYNHCGAGSDWWGGELHIGGVPKPTQQADSVQGRARPQQHW